MLESTENIFEKPADVTEDSASPELNAARRKMIENTLSRGETLEPSQQEFYEKMQREDAENIHAAEREAAETDTVKASKTAIENTPESKGFNEEWRLSELNEFRKNWMEAKKIDKALKKGLINHWDVSQYKYTTKD